MAKKYDRAAEDMANIVGLEHVNFTVPDQRLAILFYITGMGFTRDPYLVTGVENMWAANFICRLASRRCCAAGSGC